MAPTVSFLIFLMTVFSASCANRIGIQNRDSSSSAVLVSPTLPQETILASPATHFDEGLRLHVAGDNEKAIDEMTKAAEGGYENQVGAYRWIAEWYSILGKHEDEARTYRKLIKINPNDPIDHWALAKVLVQKLGKYEEGIEEAKIAQKLYEITPYIHDGLIGEAYDNLEDYENALVHYKIFLKGVSYAPLSKDYKDTKKRISELEKILKERAK